jgi:very-short-patch-repair endonuclease
MQSVPGDLARAAAEALEICHFDAAGHDLGGPHPDRPCAKGCYECLLTYGNQLDHAAIDRHAVHDLLLRFAGAQALSTGRGESRSEQLVRLTEQSDSSLEAKFLAWLKARGLRLPDDTQRLVTEALARPDFVYMLPGAKVAVFVEGPMHKYAAVAERDADAEDRLLDIGWDVVRFPHDGDWAATVKKFPTYFAGSGRHVTDTTGPPRRNQESST